MKTSRPPYGLQALERGLVGAKYLKLGQGGLQGLLGLSRRASRAGMGDRARAQARARTRTHASLFAHLYAINHIPYQHTN